MSNFSKEIYKTCQPIYLNRFKGRKGRKPDFKCDECGGVFHSRDTDIMMLKAEVGLDGKPWFLCYDCYDLDKGWGFIEGGYDRLRRILNS